MSLSCHSIQKSVESILTKEKGSKFLGYAFPVMNEDEVKENLQKIKQKHPDATHHCYAYRLGFDGENYRANDDGEPNGTAGLPIYNQLLSKNLTFVLLVVVRYYGGTKLGVSGLIKAYKTSAEETLSLAKSKLIEKTVEYDIQFPYSSQNETMRGLERFNTDILQQDFGADCQFKIRMAKKNEAKFLAYFEPYISVKIKPV